MKIAGLVVAEVDEPPPRTNNRPVGGNVYFSMMAENPWLSVSDTGTAVYAAGNPGERRLVWVDRQGRVDPVLADVAPCQEATLSRDGRRLLYNGVNSQWVLDLATGARQRILSDTLSRHGGWLPGDDDVVVSSNRGGDWDLYTIRARGGGQLEPLLKKPFTQHPQAVSASGVIIYMERHPVTGSDLWVLTSDGHTSPLVVTPFNDTSPNFSPDGRFVAYVSDESGRNEVYAIPFPGKGDRVQVSIDGGTGTKTCRACRRRAPSS